MEKIDGNITEILHAMKGGDSQNENLLWNVVYQELRRIAHHRMQRERKGHTLSTTGLVHEAYFKLVGHLDRLEDRNHFFAFASHVMRQVLIDYARKSKAQKNNYGQKPEPIEHAEQEKDEKSLSKIQIDDLIDLNDALEELEDLNPVWAKVVVCRYFGGMKFKEIASIIERDQRTAERYWQHARKWLFSRLESGV